MSQNAMPIIYMGATAKFNSFAHNLAKYQQFSMKVALYDW